MAEFILIVLGVILVGGIVSVRRLVSKRLPLEGKSQSASPGAPGATMENMEKRIAILEDKLNDRGEEIAKLRQELDFLNRLLIECEEADRIGAPKAND